MNLKFLHDKSLPFLFLLPFLLGACASVPSRISLVDVRNAPVPADPFLAPLYEARLLSPFGPRQGRLHTGIDLQNSRRGGEPIYSSRAGVVKEAKLGRGYGLMVALAHPDGYQTRYAHLKSISVKAGEAVEKGHVLGFVGKTGNATTPHLHFEIITPQGSFVDPWPFLYGDKK